MRAIGVIAMLAMTGSILLPTAQVVVAKTCTAAEQSTYGCVGGGSIVTVTETRRTPGRDAEPRSQRTDAGHENPGETTAPFVCVFDALLLPHCVAIEAHPPRPGTDAMPSLSVSDLAGFAPATARVAAEPDNVGVAGLPTNFLSAAQVHTRTGELFGTPVRVRFTPVGYDYEYGDGSSATLTAAGRSWRDLRQAQFTATRTSHVYSHRGTYSAEVDIRYTAEVDLGTGWLDVIGELRSEGEPQEITVHEARTALVARTCGENPAAPGC
ncbi:hypothetical protein DXT68_09580 [Microbacterium foliorum]|uniref:PKD domain-containing protein n=1 Tax=Microbacterium foliorum TaxID=104336 RepID=A0A0F0KIR3_9MICO|nr:hypothetical protein [Microbacterium foliorum]AXL12362.1 hypothetical protein DXT68_09580 [Microbacterium foliorum]KJL20045.1 hypothetical protein RN50_02222 [Microbacterium foliorum]